MALELSRLSTRQATRKKTLVDLPRIHISSAATRMPCETSPVKKCTKTQVILNHHPSKAQGPIQRHIRHRPIMNSPPCSSNSSTTCKLLVHSSGLHTLQDNFIHYMMASQPSPCKEYRLPQKVRYAVRPE